MHYILILFFLLAPNLSAYEHRIDLALSDTYLSSYQYAPKIQNARFGRITINKKVRSYYYYIPRNKKGAKAPVLLAFHGAGRTGLSMVDTWQKAADQNHFIIIAPNGLNKNWDIRRDEFPLIQAALNDVLKQNRFKKTKVYLFGHSNGARQAIVQAVRNPDFFEKAAVHAGTLPFSRHKGRKIAKKNLCIGLFIGDRDDIFSTDSARKTTHWLSSIGFESNLIILENHTHWYYSDAHQINTYIWKYLNEN